MRWSLVAYTAGLSLVAAACIASAPTGINQITGDGGQGAGFETTNQTSVATGSVTNDPHAVLSLSPPHGPFPGGQAVVINGKGFTTDVRVWFGAQEADGVLAIDPTQAQVNVPAGEAGSVDVHAQNGDDESTHRTLIAGYTYDALYAVPNSGPVAGGTIISIFGQDTDWKDGVEARVDQKACTTVTVVSPTELSCTVPQGTTGTKSVAVEQDADVITALDAYTYADSEDGFKGGLSGDPIAGELKVLVYNDFTGDPIPAAHVIVGTNLSDGIYQQTDATGVAIINDAEALGSAVTVTVTAECHSPITFVDVPVDTVTTYLDPILTPQCADGGDPPPSGGNPVLTGLIEGELVWESGQEFQKGPWINVPAPKAGEERVAYLFFATRDPSRNFQLPGSSSYRVTEASEGDLGYGFALYQVPGNHIMYALAGIRDTDSGAFAAYSMGMIKGVAVAPGELTNTVYIQMNTVLDQVLTMDVDPPPPGPKGPDRLDARIVVELAQQAYAIIPGAAKTPFIPLSGDLPFVGIPPLDGNLAGSRYISSARAVTGPSLRAPMSVVADFATTSTSETVAINGFVVVPQLATPPPGGPWSGTNLATNFQDGGQPIDLSVYEVISGGGLIRWVVAVPDASHAIQLPDLSGFDLAHIPPGPVTIGVYGAHIDQFDYGNIGYRNLRPSGMSAFSLDVFDAYLAQ